MHTSTTPSVHPINANTQVYLRVTPLCAARLLAAYSRVTHQGGIGISSTTLKAHIDDELELFCTDLAGEPTTSAPGQDPHKAGVAMVFQWLGMEAPLPTSDRGQLKPGILYHEFSPPLYSGPPRYRRSVLSPRCDAGALVLTSILVDPIACTKHWQLGKLNASPAGVPSRRHWPQWWRKRNATKYGIAWARWLEYKAVSLTNDAFEWSTARKHTA